MKKLAVLLMCLSVSMFALGCPKGDAKKPAPKPPAEKKDDDKKPPEEPKPPETPKPPEGETK